MREARPERRKRVRDGNMVEKRSIKQEWFYCGSKIYIRYILVYRIILCAWFYKAQFNHTVVLR